MGVQDGGFLIVCVPLVSLGLFHFWKHQKLLRSLKKEPKELVLAEYNWWASWTFIFFVPGISVVFLGFIFAVFTQNDWAKWLMLGGAMALTLAHVCYRKANVAAAIFRSL